MKLFVTILENSPELAIEAIRRIDADHDGVEIRAEKFESNDFAALRAATRKPIIFTRRGLAFDAANCLDGQLGRVFQDRHEELHGWRSLMRSSAAADLRTSPALAHMLCRFASRR